MLDDAVQADSGKYFSECGAKSLLWTATDSKVGERLWVESMKMVELE